MKRIFSILFTLVLVVSFSLIPSALVGASPGPGLAALWHFDEGTGATASDSSGNDNTGTLSGGRFGGALDFDGDDYVQLPASNTILDTDTFTIEAWFKTSINHPAYGVGDKEGRIVNLHRMGTASTAVSLYVEQDKIGLLYYTGSGHVWVKYTVTYHDGEWHHIAVTHDDTTYKLYYDGSQVASQAGAFGDFGTYPAYFGTYNSSERFFNGVIDEVRISNVARYTADFTPSTTPFSPDVNTAGLWHLDESVGSTAEDETTNNNDGTINGASWARPTWTTGKFSNALSFDGTNDYVNFGSGVSSLIAGDYTIEAWIKPASLSSGRHAVMSFSYMELGHNAGKVYFWQAYDNSWGRGYKYKSPTVLLDVTKFTHIVGVFHLDAGVDLYVDGNYIGSDTTKTGTSVNIFGNTYAGVWYQMPPIGPGGAWFDGIIDEVRIWDVALTAAQIAESASLGEAGNNASYDTILSHEAGSSVFIFTSAFHRAGDSDTIRFRLMRVGSTETIDGTVPTNGISIRRVTPKGSTWELDSVADGDPSATERDIDPGAPEGPRSHQTLHLDANLTGGLEPLGFNLHTKGL